MEKIKRILAVVIAIGLFALMLVVAFAIVLWVLVILCLIYVFMRARLAWLRHKGVIPKKPAKASSNRHEGDGDIIDVDYEEVDVVVEELEDKSK